MTDQVLFHDPVCNRESAPVSSSDSLPFQATRPEVANWSAEQSPQISEWSKRVVFQ